MGSDRKYLKYYVKLGTWTVLFIVGSPIWLPLAILGYAVDRLIDRWTEKAVEYERKKARGDFDG